MEQAYKNITNKTKEEILATEYEELNSEEKMLYYLFKRYDMSLEDAIDSLDMLP